MEGAGATSIALSYDFDQELCLESVPYSQLPL